jgi:GxxExxY protein
MRDLEEISAIVVDCGLRIHKALGPGLLESVYETVLATWLEREGLKVARQVPISFEFEGVRFKDAFRVDLVVEDQLIIEIKSVETLNKVHGKQLLTYLRLMQQPLGLLMNFSGGTFKEGLRRIVNHHQNFAPSRLRVNQSATSSLEPKHDWESLFNREPCPDFTDVNEKYDENGNWIP